jgi:hypothetical protein
MSIRETVISQFENVRRNSKKHLPPLTDDLILLDSGIDSLGVAIVVTRLEEALGVDPFTESDIAAPPVTLGEFIQLYERAGQSRYVDQGHTQ